MTTGRLPGVLPFFLFPDALAALLDEALLLATSGLFLVAVCSGDRPDVRCRSRRAARAVALIRSHAGGPRRDEEEPAALAGVVELDQRPVFVRADEGLMGEEEDVPAIGRGREERGVVGRASGRDQLDGAAVLPGPLVDVPVVVGVAQSQRVP